MRNVKKELTKILFFSLGTNVASPAAAAANTWIQPPSTTAPMATFTARHVTGQGNERNILFSVSEVQKFSSIE